MWGKKKRQSTTAPIDPNNPELGSVTSTNIGKPEQELVIAALDEEWSRDLADKRAWVASSVASDGPPLDLADPATALAVIQAILADGVGPEERWKLEALGVLLGDALSADLGVPWMVVTDEWGTTAALHVGGELIAYPISMIAKRVEDGEEVDVNQVFAGVSAHLRQLI